MAWGAFRAQTAYIVMRLASWMKEPGFVGFQPERSEDVDVRFDVQGRAVRELHQVKTGELNPTAVAEVVQGFRARFQVTANEQVESRRFILASPRFTEPVRQVVAALARYRKLDMAAATPERQATLEALRARFDRVGLGDEFEFILERVEFFEDFTGLHESSGGDPDSRHAVIADGLHRHVDELKSYRYEELRHAVVRLLSVVDDSLDRFWAQDELLAVIRSAIAEWRAGPPQPNRDLTPVRHETLTAVQAPPASSDAPELFGARRIRPAVFVGALVAPPWDQSTLDAQVRAIADSDSPFREAIRDTTSDVLYYGFPHVPFAVLAGFVTGQQRHIHLAEHDRTTGRFSWSPGGLIQPLLKTRSENTTGSVAMVRVSISAGVKRIVCREALTEDPRLDLEFSFASPHRGAIRSEAHARDVADQVRQALDSTIAGDPEFGEVHLFAAIPVSVAFLLGQALSGTALPRTFVHNYTRGDSPSYRWSVCLQAAAESRPAVRMAEARDV